MNWAEDNKVDDLFELAKTMRLITKIRPELDQARAEMDKTGHATRVFVDFIGSTLKSWSPSGGSPPRPKFCRRPTRSHAIRKKTNLGKANPRFVVTSINTEEHDAQTLYEKLYCARGDMENRIKDKQFNLFGTRTSAASMRSNQIRLWLSGFAYTFENASPHRSA